MRTVTIEIGDNLNWLLIIIAVATCTAVVSGQEQATKRAEIAAQRDGGQ